jgi:lipid-A-disaccharide synthase
MSNKKFYIIAGEVSGDMHAANLVRAMHKIDSDIRFKGFGGEKMLKANVKISRGLDKLSQVGFLEIIKQLGDIKKNFKIAKSEILEFKPDALILLDYPGFNLRMAEWAKSQGIKVFFYISPQVWAWGKKRVVKMKKFIDQLFVILPFEEEFFRKNGINAEFVGNPLIEEIDKFEVQDDFHVKYT